MAVHASTLHNSKHLALAGLRNPPHAATIPICGPRVPCQVTVVCIPTFLAGSGDRWDMLCMRMLRPLVLSVAAQVNTEEGRSGQCSKLLARYSPNRAQPKYATTSSITICPPPPPPQRNIAMHALPPQGGRDAPSCTVLVFFRYRNCEKFTHALPLLLLKIYFLDQKDRTGSLLAYLFSTGRRPGPRAQKPQCAATWGLLLPNPRLSSPWAARGVPTPSLSLSPFLPPLLCPPPSPPTDPNCRACCAPKLHCAHCPIAALLPPSGRLLSPSPTNGASLRTFDMRMDPTIHAPSQHKWTWRITSTAWRRFGSGPRDCTQTRLFAPFCQPPGVPLIPPQSLSQSPGAG